jgi:hypothetical protein
MSLLFINFDVSPSRRRSNPTNLPPHKLCLGCSSPYHNSGDCPHWRQFTNLPYGQLNINFSEQGFESHSNFYTPNRNNHSDVSWYACAMGNYALQSHELYHLEYPQFNTHSSMPSSYSPPPRELLVQHFPTAHIDDLEERANQLMATRCVHTQFPHTYAFHQSCEYCYHPSHRFDDCPFYIHYVSQINKSAHENAQTTTTLVSEEKAVSKVKEKKEQFELPPILNWFNDKDVSIEAHSFVTIPLETYHAPHISHFQCLEEPSYVEIFLKNFYTRCQNILPEGYLILKKKGWKGLVRHPNERGRCGNFPFLFSALHF